MDSRLRLVIGILILSALACGPLGAVGEIERTVGAAQQEAEAMATELEQSMPTLEAQLTESAPQLEEAMTQMPELEEALTQIPDVEGGIAAFGDKQWASGASATSQYGDPGWSAMQATGEPNVSECGDIQEAWASQFSNGVDTLTLNYDTPYLIVGVEIYQTYNPGSITGVTVTDGGGNSQVIYEAQPQAMDLCPYVLEITPVVLFPVSQVIIDVDQSVTGNWNEIDAVALVGAPAE